MNDDATTPGPTPARSEVDARFALVLARFGDRLDDAGRATIRQRIVRQVEEADALRGMTLANGDEPEILFSPYRSAAGEEAR